VLRLVELLLEVEVVAAAAFAFVLADFASPLVAAGFSVFKTVGIV
jgi:hypothetical protein